MTQYIFDMKPMIRISKSAIRTLIGKMLNYGIKYEYSYQLDENACITTRNCPIITEYQELVMQLEEARSNSVPDFNKIKELSSRIASIKSDCAGSGCLNCKVTKIYNNDNKKYRLYQSNYANKRLPKSIIRTYLFLFSIPQEKLGSCHFIKNIDIDLISSQLNICRATALKSLYILESFNYITLSHASSYNSFNIIISEYDNMHLPARQGGSGYFTITNDMMAELLSVSNVNALRLEILKLLKNDDDTLRQTAMSDYTIKDLKNVMPMHMNYQSQFVKISKSQPSLFSTEISEGHLRFILKSGYSLRYSSDDYMLSFEDCINEYLKEISLELPPEIKLNVLELTREFSIRNIKLSLLQLRHTYENLSAIRNFGALLRTYCQKNYVKKIA